MQRRVNVPHGTHEVDICRSRIQRCGEESRARPRRLANGGDGGKILNKC
jgi:hypothetical protein